MAETLKSKYGPEIPEKISQMIKKVYPPFNHRNFVKDALVGYEELDLLARGRKIAAAMQRTLPSDYPKAVAILVASLGPELESTEEFGFSPFLYMPHTCFVAQFGTEHFNESMQAQYELTKRFTAEYSIRKFIELHQEKTLKLLKKWSNDSSAHVRRLVSEGTRPRLPWASRLPRFQKDPTPVIELLELLKDDPELYVRRSVANNLNDIGKDNPDVLIRVAKNWLKGASDNRRWIVQHGLRSVVKKAMPEALQLLGVGEKALVEINQPTIQPARVKIGQKIAIGFELQSSSKKKQRILVDFKIHFVKANSKTSAKVFKLKTLDLPPGHSMRLSKTVSLAEMTTRKHFPGTHKVELILNGTVHHLGSFVLLAK